MKLPTVSVGYSFKKFVAHYYQRPYNVKRKHRFSSDQQSYATLACLVVGWVTILCGGGVEYLHRSPTNRRRRQKGSVESETVKYDPESHGSRTRK
jgi:hypothetical protein